MRRTNDPWILTITMTLSMLGLLMVFSSSTVVTASTADFHYDPYFFLKRQLISMTLGVICMCLVRKVDLNRFRTVLGLPLTAVTLAMLALVMVVGPSVNGAKRWFPVGPFQFQPAEMAKLAMIFFLADSLDRRREKVAYFSRMIPALAIFGVMLVLVEQEPDLGTALVIAGVFMGMLFVAGAKLEHLATMAASGLIAVLGMIATKPFRMKRLATFVDPMADVRGDGYQLYNSILALASGGLWGRGLGNSQQKFNYLPEDHTDFIFAIVGEELGLLGGVAISMLFLALLYKGFRVAVNCRRPYLRLLAAGVSFQIVLQALMNMAVVSGAIPSTGVPLPFISYGGSSILFTMIGVGILLNVSDYNSRNLDMKRRPEKAARRMRKGATLASSSDEGQVSNVSCGAWESRAAGQRLRSAKVGLPRPAVEPTLTEYPKDVLDRRARTKAPARRKMLV